MNSLALDASEVDGVVKGADHTMITGVHSSQIAGTC